MACSSSTPAWQGAVLRYFDVERGDRLGLISGKADRLLMLQDAFLFGARGYAAAPYSFTPPGRNHLFVPGLSVRFCVPAAQVWVV